MTKRIKSKKIIYSAAFAALLIAEILIGLLAKGALRNSGGDVLAVIAIYFLIRIFTDKFPKTLPLMIFAFACFVEWLQSMDICGILGIDNRSLLAIIMGTNGNFFDICCYFMGVLMIYTYMHFEKYLLFSPQRHKKYMLLGPLILMVIIILEILRSVWAANEYNAWLDQVQISVCALMFSVGLAFCGRNFKSKFQAAVRTAGYVFAEFLLFYMGLAIGSMQDFVNNMHNY